MFTYKYVAFDGCCDKFVILTTLQKGFAGLLGEQKIDICFSISLWGRMSENIRAEWVQCHSACHLQNLTS